MSEEAAEPTNHISEINFQESVVKLPQSKEPSALAKTLLDLFCKVTSSTKHDLRVRFCNKISVSKRPHKPDPSSKRVSIPIPRLVLGALYSREESQEIDWFQRIPFSKHVD